MVQAYGRYGGLKEVGGFIKDTWDKVGDDVLDWASAKIQANTPQPGVVTSTPAPAPAPTNTTSAGSGPFALAAALRQEERAATSQSMAPATAGSSLPSWLIPAGLLAVVAAVAMTARSR